MKPPLEIKAIDVPSGAVLEQQPMVVQDTAIELVVPAEPPVQEVTNLGTVTQGDRHGRADRMRHPSCAAWALQNVCAT